MASGNTLISWRATANHPPASAYATPDTRNSHPVLDFDASTDENAIFAGVLPRHYAGGGVTVTIAWMASTATSGNVIRNAAFERLTNNDQDLDADGFATAIAASAAAANGTSGKLTYTTIAFTDGAQMDSLAVAEAFRLQVTRDADNGSDTMTGDAEVLSVEIRET